MMDNLDGTMRAYETACDLVLVPAVWLVVRLDSRFSPALVDKPLFLAYYSSTRNLQSNGP